MYLSRQERDRRYGMLRESLAKKNIDAILVMGNQNMGGSTETGSFRYLTDFYVIARYAVLLFFRTGEPILLLSSDSLSYWARRYSWIEDTRSSEDYPQTMAHIIEEKKLSAGKLGIVGMDSMPASFYLALKGRFPKAEFLDASSLLMKMRQVKGREECELLQKAGKINDEAYIELLKNLRPGIKEFEIAGILDGVQRKNGSDRTFNLISSGPFPTWPDGTPFHCLPGLPGLRAIEKGDCIVLEVTANYGGYWNQLIRVVTVGGTNARLAQFHKAALKAMDAGVEKMHVGLKTQDLLSAMAGAVEKEGFKLTPPNGHYCGLNLKDADFDHPEGQMVLAPNMASILHPTLSDAKGIEMFWGETYLTTDRGPVRLNKTDDRLTNV